MPSRLAALVVAALAAAAARAQDVAGAARAQYRAQDWAGLEKSARIWVSGEAGSAEAHRALGIALVKLGRPEEAVEPLRRAVAVGGDADDRFWLGRALFDAGEFAAAETEQRAALAQRPSDLGILASLASSLAGQGRYREAMRSQERAAALAPDNAGIADVLVHWKAAARWDFPQEALARHARARWLYNRHRYREAIDEYEAALRVAPGFADCHYHLGAAARRLGDGARAEREYRAALAGYDSEDRMPRGSAEYGLGELLAQRRETAAEGVALLRRAMAPEAHGRKPPMVFTLAQALETAGDIAGARDAYLEFLSAKLEAAYPEFPAAEATEKARDKLVTNGCRPEASDPPRFAAARCAPIAAVDRFLSGVEHRNAGRMEAALASFDAALAIDGQYLACQVARGQALESLKRWDRAEAALREALRATPAELRSWRATAQVHLALTLVDLRKGGAEAVLLATEARARAARDVPRQAWHDILLGRAFALAGNRPCAVEKLEGVVRAAGVPDHLKARARQLLRKLPSAAEGQAARACFEYEAYRPTDLGEFLALQRREQGSHFGPEKFQLRSLEKLRARVQAKGERRPVADDRRWFLDKLVAERYLPREHVALYQKEVLVSGGGRDWWLPIQGPLLEDLDAEVKPGSEVDLYVVWTGIMREELILLVTEFRAVPP